MVKNSPIFSLTHSRTIFFGRNSGFSITWTGLFHPLLGLFRPWHPPLDGCQGRPASSGYGARRHRGKGQQVQQPHQVIGGEAQQRLPGHLGQTFVADLAQAPHGLSQPKASSILFRRLRLKA
jgi:hypothetical protein